MATATKRHVVLKFEGKRPELEELLCYPGLPEERGFRLVRGKSEGAHLGCSTFQWTKAVQAFCLVLVSCRIAFLNNRLPSPLVGRKGSLATSLDYALAKEPQWVRDLFGTDSHGRANLRRAFVRSNSSGKRDAPVAVGLNYRFLPLDSISIKIGDEDISNSLSALSTLDFALNTQSERISLHQTATSQKI
jgi:hypothetical protein